MEGISAAAIVLGVCVSALLCLLSARADRSLASYRFWFHYVPTQARSVRRWTYTVHLVIGLAGGIALSLLLHWFPFGDSIANVALAGVAWAGVSEALLRAELVVVDMGAARPGTTLLRRILVAQHTQLQQALEAELHARILARSSTDAGLVDLLVECVGFSTPTQPLAAEALSQTVNGVAARLVGPAPERAAARVEALRVIFAEVKQQQRQI